MASVGVVGDPLAAGDSALAAAPVALVGARAVLAALVVEALMGLMATGWGVTAGAAGAGVVGAGWASEEVTSATKTRNG